MAAKRISRLFNRAREVVAPALDALDTQRDLIARLQEEFQAVEQSRRSRAEAEAAAQAQIADLARRLAPAFAGMARPGAHIGEAREIFREAAKHDLLGLMAALAPTQLHRLVSEGLDAAYAQGDGISGAERAERLDSLRSQLRTAELEEEALIRGLEAAALPALRRADANPEIVLADDSEMPE